MSPFFETQPPAWRFFTEITCILKSLSLALTSQWSIWSNIYPTWKHMKAYAKWYEQKDKQLNGSCFIDKIVIIVLPLLLMALLCALLIFVLWNVIWTIHGKYHQSWLFYYSHWNNLIMICNNTLFFFYRKELILFLVYVHVYFFLSNLLYVKSKCTKLNVTKNLAH